MSEAFIAKSAMICFNCGGVIAENDEVYFNEFEEPICADCHMGSEDESSDTE